MEQYSTVVIGGGAAGICAAISAGRLGKPVIICEKTAQLGKKILASGDGRCNLLNEDFDETHYNSNAKELVKSVLNRYGKSFILDFFNSLGLQVYSREGRMFPITNQASSVLKVLEMEIRRLAVSVGFNFDCSGISFHGNSILVSSRAGQKFECRKVIITGGGKTYPAFGSDGSTYEIARQVGHTIIEPVPAVVPLIVKDSLCQALQGQRIFASARSLVEGEYGEEIRGELLFTKYGLSGTCILDISEAISLALNRYHRPEALAVVDMVPFMSEEQLKQELNKRKREKWPAEDMLAGILPNKLGLALQDLFTRGDINTAIKLLKARRFRVSGTRGWNEAEFTSGGIDVSEINNETLESRLKRGVYFAGEVLDVNGKRGGYNLGWAWASGLLAGTA